MHQWFNSNDPFPQLVDHYRHSNWMYLTIKHAVPREIVRKLTKISRMRISLILRCFTGENRPECAKSYLFRCSKWLKELICQ